MSFIMVLVEYLAFQWPDKPTAFADRYTGVFVLRNPDRQQRHNTSQQGPGLRHRFTGALPDPSHQRPATPRSGIYRLVYSALPDTGPQYDPHHCLTVSQGKQRREQVRPRFIAAPTFLSFGPRAQIPNPSGLVR